MSQICSSLLGKLNYSTSTETGLGGTEKHEVKKHGPEGYTCAAITKKLREEQCVVPQKKYY